MEKERMTPAEQSGQIERVSGLLDGLRKDGFSLGMGEYADAHRLLLRLAALGKLPDDPRKWESLLKPLLCASPEEQRRFPDRYAHWLTETVSAIADDKREADLPKEIKTLRRWGRWADARRWGFGLTGAMILFLIWELRPGLNVEWLCAQLLGLAVAALLAHHLVVRLLAWRYLRREPGKGKFQSAKFYVVPKIPDLFPEPGLRALSMAMRRPEPSGLQILDIPTTIDRTIRNGRRFEPVCRRGFQTPEYLILADRRAFRDHAADRVQTLVAGLERMDTPADLFFFDLDPQICFPLGERPASVELSALARRYSNRRLLVFGNPDEFSQHAADRLNSWKHRAFFDVLPRGDSHRGRARVFPADEAGILAAIGQFNDETSVFQTIPGVVDRLPAVDVIDTPGLHWNESPNKKDVEDLIAALFGILDENGRRWLCACAVYPELRWGVTLHLGTTLKGPDNHPLFDRARLLALCRLPWFRYGSMPDWFRRRLRYDDSFRGGPARDTKKALFLLMKNLTAKGPLAMDAAVSLDSVISRIFRMMAKKDTTPGSPLNDPVFMGVMTDSLAVRIARETVFNIQKSLQRDRKPENRIALPPRPGSPMVVPLEIGGRRITLRFAWIPPGTFMMGSPEDEAGRYNDEKQHRVTLTKGFYMQTTPVTQGQYEAVTGNNPSDFKDGGPDCPVETVSWEDAQAFIKQLNKMSEHTFRLPTEAEWEYACRAGTTTPFHTGNCLSSDTEANYDGNYPLEGCPKGVYRKKTTPVGKFPPNAWGLCDMHGNVYDWCEDWYGEYPTGETADPPGPPTGSVRVLRGGSWLNYAGYCRSAYRGRDWPGDRVNRIGFRLVCLPGQ